MYNFTKDLVSHFWNYRERYFRDRQELFDKPSRSKDRPPVFLRRASSENVLIKPGATEKIRQEVLDQIKQRHKWFHSMKSSQALAQSVFGNLRVFKKLECLADLKGDNGKPLFIIGPDPYKNFCMEYEVDYLNEPRQTNIDVFFDGDYRIAVECKLSEPEVGSCSRPRLRPKKDPAYEEEYCDGRYVRQRSRKERCTLTELKIKYWEYIPKLMNWQVDIDHDKCPLRYTYQLIPNMLAVCVRPDGRLDPKHGHAVLLYDEHSPIFNPGGKGWNAWQNTKAALKDPGLLQMCTWQQVIGAMRRESNLSWLTDLLREKYGF